MADFDIPLLRTFVSVADSGGFARAGQRVHRTQSTVSQQIKKLEQEAGRQLLVRNARATRLTPDGERLLAYARRILALHDEARNLFAEDMPELVRIGLVEDHAVSTLSELLGAVAREHPQARLEVSCGVSALLQDELAAGRLDIALFRQLRPARPEREASIDTWTDAPYWVAGPGAAPETLPVLPLVLFPPGCVFRAHALEQLEASGRRWRLTYSSPNPSGVLAAVQAGLGVSLLSRHMLPPGGWRLLDRSAGLPASPRAQLALRACAAPGPAAQAVLAGLRARLNACHAPERGALNAA